jgi:hypothetical protein
MLSATHVSPSDNKPVLGGLKSILGMFTGRSDNASRSGQQIRADHSCQQLATHQHRPPAATSTALATAGHRSPATDHHSTQLTTGRSWPQLATISHHRPISWPPQAANRPKTQQNQAKIGVFLRENQRLPMTLYPPIEKSIIQLLSYCIYPVILYKNTVILVKNGIFLACERLTPPPQKFCPLFFQRSICWFFAE